MSWVCVVFPLFSARIGNHQSVNLQSWWVVLTSGCPSGSERINGTAVWGFANLLLTQPWWQGMCFLIYNQRQLYMHIIIIKCVCVHVRDIMTLNTTLLWHSILIHDTEQLATRPIYIHLRPTLHCCSTSSFLLPVHASNLGHTEYNICFDTWITSYATIVMRTVRNTIQYYASQKIRNLVVSSISKECFKIKYYYFSCTRTL